MMTHVECQNKGTQIVSFDRMKSYFFYKEEVNIS